MLCQDNNLTFFLIIYNAFGLFNIRRVSDKNPLHLEKWGVHESRWNHCRLCDRFAAMAHLAWCRRCFTTAAERLHNASWKSWILYKCLSQHWILSTPNPPSVSFPQASSCCHKHPLTAGAPVSCDSSLIPGLICVVISLFCLPARYKLLTSWARWIIHTRTIIYNLL